MANELVTQRDRELIPVLQSSLYPGASAASIELVLGYCKAAGLDPMLKPVHIVPMWDSKTKSMRDVVMAGVGLYRTQASRSGQWAGMSEPEFGPIVDAELDGVKVSYPEWCRVTVKRLMSNGAVAEFTAVEYWTENYATKGRDTVAPNAMWSKRPRGQLAKCAAAQALRIAFPELGAAPTAEELEGKPIDVEPPPPAVEIDPALLSGAREAAMRGTDVYATFWGELTREQRKMLVDMHPSLKEAAAQADTARTVDVTVAVTPETPTDEWLRDFEGTK